MRCLSGDLLQGSYNICKPQMHVVLQKGNRVIGGLLQLSGVIPCLFFPLQDVQVPVCPLCNIPIPVKRGEMPDIKVGEHIDRDCRSDPAQRKRKVRINPDVCQAPPSVRKEKQQTPVSVFQIFTNKCSKGGCKQKEMMRVTCDQCHLNFCLKHRHPLDHDCKPDGKPLSKSGWVQPHPAGSEGGTVSSDLLSSSQTCCHDEIKRVFLLGVQLVLFGKLPAHFQRREQGTQQQVRPRPLSQVDINGSFLIDFLSLAPPSGSPPQCQHRMSSLHQRPSRQAW